MGPPWGTLGPYLGSKSWNVFKTQWSWSSRVLRMPPYQFQLWKISGHLQELPHQCGAWIRWSCYHLKETTEEVEGLSGINLKWQNWMIFLKRKKNFIPILPAFCLLICWMMTTLHSTQVHKWTMVMSTTRSCSHSSWYYFCACQGNSHVRDCVMTLRDTEVHSCC